MKSKWMIGLVAVVLMLTLAPSSFAQIQILVNNTPSGKEIDTARHAVTADPFSPGSGILVSGSLIATSVLTTTGLTLTFPAPITAGIQTAGLGASIPSAFEAIRIEGAVGAFVGATISTINYAGGTITLVLPGTSGLANPVGSGSLSLIGVRMDVTGKTAPLTLSQASLSSSANGYIGPSTLPTLITALDKGLSATNGLVIGSFNGTNSGTALIFTNNSIVDSTASIVIGEGFASAWRTATQQSTSGVTTALLSTQVRLTISGLPAGITVTVTTPTPAAGIPGITLSNTAFTAGTLTISMTSTDMTVVESIPLLITFGGAATGTLTAGSLVTVVATMAPVNGATAVTPPNVTNGYPRFTQADTAALTIATINAAKTTMLVPYAARLGAYDTGLAIANTTKDPFTTGGATATNGPLSFYLYPRTDTGAGTSANFTTDSTKRPGAGLDVNGNVVAGGTWSGLLSQVLAQTSLTGDYIGYLFIEANFLDAHGVAYLLTGSTISSGLPIMVMPQPSVLARSTSLETLGF